MRALPLPPGAAREEVSAIALLLVDEMAGRRPASSAAPKMSAHATASTTPSGLFTADERERLRDELVSAAQNDASVCGAAHTGSAASSRLDRWSDIDLAVCLASAASQEHVVAEWTDRLHSQHRAVAHVDVMRCATL